MHDLAPRTALGGDAARESEIGGIKLLEVTGLALASVTARQGAEADCHGALARLLGNPAPGPGAAVLAEPYAAVWIAPESWMLGAPMETHEDIAAQLIAELGASASVTEQSDGWVTIDLSGPGVCDMFERLCPVPVRQMKSGSARRTMIHHMGCFLLCGAPGSFFRLLGPRSSAGSLWHALEQAARAVRPNGD